MHHARLSIALISAFAAVFSAPVMSKGSDGFVLKSTNSNQGIRAIRGTPLPAGTVVPCLNVAGRTGNGDFASGDAANSVINLNIGAGNALTGVAADITIQAFDPSYLSEAQVTFSSSDTTSPGITYTPSATDDPGTESLSTEGVIDFASIPLANIVAGADGILRIEFHESFDDESVSPDSQWSAPSVAPVVCSGLRLVCTNQAACDGTVPVTLQNFSVD